MIKIVTNVIYRVAFFGLLLAATMHNDSGILLWLTTSVTLAVLSSVIWPAKSRI